MISKVKSWFRPNATGEGNITAASIPKEPSLAEVLLMYAVVFAVHFLMVCRVSSFWAGVGGWFDNSAYLQLATVIQDRHFSGGEIAHHFWGFPYAIVGISQLLSMPQLKALALISMLASLAVCVLGHRLYAGWVAATCIFVINYRWVNISLEGGSEPLFMCLLYASFLAARSGRWNLAALLASVSTTVRPVGIFALMSFAVILTMRRSFRRLAVITLIGLAIGVLYVVPVWVILGSPFANFQGYQGDWGPRGWPLTYPFGAWGCKLPLGP